METVTIDGNEWRQLVFRGERWYSRSMPYAPDSEFRLGVGLEWWDPEADRHSWWWSVADFPVGKALRLPRFPDMMGSESGRDRACRAAIKAAERLLPRLDERKE